jgi:hypothetical protein
MNLSLPTPDCPPSRERQRADLPQPRVGLTQIRRAGSPLLNDLALQNDEHPRR